MSVSIKDLDRDPNLLSSLTDKLRYDKFTGWKLQPSQVNETNLLIQ